MPGCESLLAIDAYQALKPCRCVHMIAYPLLFLKARTTILIQASQSHAGMSWTLERLQTLLEGSTEPYDASKLIELLNGPIEESWQGLYVAEESLDFSWLGEPDYFDGEHASPFFSMGSEALLQQWRGNVDSLSTLHQIAVGLHSQATQRMMRLEVELRALLAAKPELDLAMEIEGLDPATQEMVRIWRTELACRKDLGELIDTTSKVKATYEVKADRLARRTGKISEPKQPSGKAGAPSPWPEKKADAGGRSQRATRIRQRVRNAYILLTTQRESLPGRKELNAALAEMERSDAMDLVKQLDEAIGFAGSSVEGNDGRLRLIITYLTQYDPDFLTRAPRIER